MTFSVRILSSFQVRTMPLANSWEEFFPLSVVPPPSTTEMGMLANLMYACGVESPSQLLCISLDELLENADTLNTDLNRYNTIVQAYMLVIHISSREYRDDEV